MNKISIIGTGSVGSTIAYTLTAMGLASEIVVIDINTEKALGEALDIRQGVPVLPENPVRRVLNSLRRTLTSPRALSRR